MSRLIMGLGMLAGQCGNGDERLGESHLEMTGY